MVCLLFLCFLYVNNFLSGWGLGGAQPLAAAKANLAFAPTVYLQTNDLFLQTFCARFLGRGVGEPSCKKVPPQKTPLANLYISYIKLSKRVDFYFEMR